LNIIISFTVVQEMQRNLILLSKQKFIKCHLQAKHWATKLWHTWWWQHNPRQKRRYSSLWNNIRRAL